MNVLIRTDIGGDHGMGHAVRMLALARELQRRGASVTFVTSTDALRNYVVPFRCYLRQEYVRDMPDIYVIDTKTSDESNDDGILAQMRDRRSISPFDSSRRPGSDRLKIVRIDHSFARGDSCDLLVGPCAHWDEATVAWLHSIFGDRFLYGWEYVLLDPLMTLMPPVPQEHQVTKSIVFTAGGSDPTHALQTMYDLTEYFLSTRQLVFLVGSHAQMLTSRPGTKRLSQTLVTSFDRVWIRHAEYVVTLFGVTSYEALWWEVPQVIFAHTDENRIGAQQFAFQIPRMAICSGDIHHETSKTFRQTLQGMLEHGLYAPRPPAFDGLGVQRVATAIQLLDR